MRYHFSKRIHEEFTKRFFASLVISTALFAGAMSPETANASLAQLLKNGAPYIDARYRYEFVEQDGLADNAHASTLRTRLGYKSGEFHGVSGTLEFENITYIGTDNFNDTLNGRTTHPVVADTEDTAVNQAFLQYSAIDKTRIRVGREAINLDAQRFIGSVGWRQNDQTVDTVSVVNTSLKDTTITYAYLHGINRIFGTNSPMGDWDSDSHIVNASYTGLPIGKLTGYGYFLDFESDAPAASGKTYGFSLTGKQALNDKGLAFKYHAEYARQSDFGDNPVSYSADYIHIAPALSYKGLTATIGYELLGSDNGNIGFSTPLATLHKFNGWADKFLTTPANGLEDMYVDISYKFSGPDGKASVLNGLFVKAQYHDFSADEGGVDYGNEIGFHAQMPIADNYYIHARYADYNADSFATDTRKFILGLGVKF